MNGTIICRTEKSVLFVRCIPQTKQEARVQNDVERKLPHGCFFVAINQNHINTCFPPATRVEPCHEQLQFIQSSADTCLNLAARTGTGGTAAGNDPRRLGRWVSGEDPLDLRRDPGRSYGGIGPESSGQGSGVSNL